MATTCCEPWEWQPAETPKAFAAFCAYRDMPPETRSIRHAWEAVRGQAPRQTGTGPRAARQWHDWSAKYGWVARSAAWDREQDGIVRARLARTVADARQRRLAEAQWLHVTGWDKLREMAAAEHTIPAAVALRMIELGHTAERLDAGEATERAEVSGPAGAPLVVSVAQLGAMVRRAKQDGEQ